MSKCQRVSFKKWQYCPDIYQNVRKVFIIFIAINFEYTWKRRYLLPLSADANSMLLIWDTG